MARRSSSKSEGKSERMSSKSKRESKKGSKKEKVVTSTNLADEEVATTPRSDKSKKIDNTETMKSCDEGDDVSFTLSEGEEELREAEKAELEREREAFVTPLLMHAYHLPGYGWKRDWWQYMTNNHPVVGIWLHHKYHPLKSGVRIMSLIGSILFGLALTNIIYLAFVFTQTDPDQEYIFFSTNATQTGLNEDLDAATSTLSVTTGNIALWTVGSFLHGLWDNTIWSLAACTCCMKERGGKLRQEEKMRRYRSTGAFLVMFSVLCVVALATFVVTLRKAVQADEDATTTNVTVTVIESHYAVHGELQQITTEGGVEYEDYEFVVSYLVELVLNYVVYYPLVGTILFAGILNCGGKFPFLGGRPQELRELEMKDEDYDDIEEGIEVAWKDEGDEDSSTGSVDSPVEDVDLRR